MSNLVPLKLVHADHALFSEDHQCGGEQTHTSTTLTTNPKQNTKPNKASTSDLFQCLMLTHNTCNFSTMFESWKNIL